MSLQEHKQDWESLAKLDACWAILTDPSRQFGRWDLDEFFRLGEVEINSVWGKVQTLGYPKSHDRVLDFGCGLGRLTRHLARYFKCAVGIDISEEMVLQAKALHSQSSNVSFFVNAADDLQMFESGTFDMVYTNVVLQHLPNHSLIFKYLQEFGRVLSPAGILVFQLPAHIPWPFMLQPRRRIYNFLRGGGVSDQFLYRRLRLNPMRMTYVRENKVRSVLQECGLEPLQVEASRIETFLRLPLANRTYFCIRQR